MELKIEDLNFPYTIATEKILGGNHRTAVRWANPGENNPHQVDGVSHKRNRTKGDAKGGKKMGPQPWKTLKTKVNSSSF